MENPKIGDRVIRAGHSIRDCVRGKSYVVTGVTDKVGFKSNIILSGLDGDYNPRFFRLVVKDVPTKMPILCSGDIVEFADGTRAMYLDENKWLHDKGESPVVISVNLKDNPIVVLFSTPGNIFKSLSFEDVLWQSTPKTNEDDILKSIINVEDHVHESDDGTITVPDSVLYKLHDILYEGEEVQ